MNDDELIDLLRTSVPEPPRPLPADLPSTRRVLPVLAVVTAVLAVVVLVAVLRPTHTTRAVPSLPPIVGCPANPPSKGVPAQPTARGTDTNMVPTDEEPISASMCQYGVKGLDGDEVTITNPGAMADDLDLPADNGTGASACDGFIVPERNYLLHLIYPDGDVWVFTGEGCEETTNGQFMSDLGVGQDARESYALGTWTLADPGPGACGGHTGRRGQEDVIVPSGPSSVSVCTKGRVDREQITDPSTVARLAALLDGPASSATNNFCQGGPTNSVILVFHYPRGRGVDVAAFDGCNGTNTSNGQRAAELSPEDLAEVYTLTGN